MVCFVSTDALFFHTVMGEEGVNSLTGTGRHKKARWGKKDTSHYKRKNLSKSVGLKERQYDKDSPAE